VKSEHLGVAAFDPDMISVMLAALDEAASAVSADETTRSLIARRILAAATQGERDPARLRRHALRSLAN
jgi:hypothetical protein